MMAWEWWKLVGIVTGGQYGTKQVSSSFFRHDCVNNSPLLILKAQRKQTTKLLFTKNIKKNHFRLFVCLI